MERLLLRSISENVKRGPKVPFFFVMIPTERIKALADVFLSTRPDLFVVSLTVLPGNRIVFRVDGDDGVTIEDCVAVSRAIEHNLDREAEDFELEVASAGVDQPLAIPRQFQKNIGRSLRLTLSDRSTREGKLVSATEEGFILEYSKKEGKKKISVEESISYQELHQAFVNISFR